MKAFSSSSLAKIGIFLCLISAVYCSTTGSTTLYVNASITTASGSSYPDLQSAVSALYSGNTLITTTNTIILLPNCAGKTFNLSKAVNGSGSESILIQFQNPPPVVDAYANCSQLPILNLTALNGMNVQNLASFSLIGLSLMYRWKNLGYELQQIGNVNFANFCLDMTDTFTTTAPTNNASIRFQNVANVNFSNAYISHDGSKNISLDGVTNVTMSSVMIYFTKYLLDSYYVVIATHNTASSSSKIIMTVSNVQMICNSSSMSMPGAFYSEYIYAVYYSNLSVSNCDFSNYTSLEQQSFLSSNGCLNSFFENITFNNVTFGQSDGLTLIYTNASQNVSITNIQADYLASQTTGNWSWQYFFYIENMGSASTGMTLNMANITVNNSNFGNMYIIIYLLMFYPSYWETMQIDNLTVNNTRLPESGYIIWASLDLETNNSITLTPILLTINNFRVDYCNIIRTSGIWITYRTDVQGWITAIEPFHVEYLNPAVTNSILENSVFWAHDGVMAQFVALQASNITMRTLSSLIQNRYVPSSLFIIESNFSGFVLYQASNIISDDGSSSILTFNYATVTGLSEVEYAYYADNSTLYAETRPFVVYNTVFSNIQIENDSAGIYARNPQSIVQNCNFSNITQINARLLQLGEYILYANDYAHFAENITYVYMPTTTNFVFFTAAEAAVLSGNALRSSLFYDARNQSCNYHPQNCAYFVLVQGNKFDQIAVENSDFLVGSDSFSIPNGSIALLNNSFSNITGDCSIGFPIISIDSVNIASIVGNTFEDIDILGYAFSLQSSLLDDFFFNSNALLNTLKLAAYYLEAGECNNITILNTIGINLETENDFISITCGLIDTQVLLQNSTFQSISQTSTLGKSLAINFISIGTQNFSTVEIGNIIIEGNIFQKISISRENGYTIETGSTCFLSVFMTQSSVVIQDNFLALINVPNGNIMMISVPNLTIQNSSIYNSSFGDAKGGLVLIFGNLTMIGSTFKDSNSSNYIGAGLIQLIAPGFGDNFTIYATILGCSFLNNNASYGTVFYIASSQINFYMGDSQVSDNLVSVKGGVIYFYNNSNSNITLENVLFTLNQEKNLTLPDLYLLALEYNSNTSVTLSGSRFELSGSIVGRFINAFSSPGLQLKITGFDFISLSADAAESSDVLTTTNGPSSLNFGFLNVDDIEAHLSGISVTNLTFDQYPLFELNCNPESLSSTQRWKLEIAQCNFKSLILNQPIITINSDEDVLGPLNNLSLVIDNSSFSNLSWMNIGFGGGIIASNTKLIGSNLTNFDEDNLFSVIIRSSIFSQLSGTQTSTIYSGQESLFSNIILIENSTFNSTQVDCLGALLNLSATLLTNDEVSGASYQNSVTVKIKNNSFENITAQEGGGIMSWMSTQKPIVVTFDNNSLYNIHASENGGVFFISYTANASAVQGSAAALLLQDFVIINITNSFFSNITSKSGGILQVQGSSSFLRVTMDNNVIQKIFVNQSGAIVNLPAEEDETPATTFRRRALGGDTDPTSGYSSILFLVGVISFSNIQFADISATNGGIIYEFTPYQTISISLVNSTLNSIQVSQRGGIAYVNQPYSIFFQNNTVTDTAADVAGTVVYSSSSKLNMTDEQNTYIDIDLNSSYAYGPTNLKIEVLNLTDWTYVNLENYSGTLSSIPTIPDLTSSSLSQLSLTLSLVYVNASGGVQTVIDNSLGAWTYLEFTSMSGFATQFYNLTNCSDSSCTESPSTVSLVGKEGDLYTVTATYNSEAYIQSQLFIIRLRGCIPGEIYQSDTEKCLPCPYGKYSLQPSDSACVACPQGADCEGNWTIFIEKGYYRSLNDSALIIIDCNDGGGTRCLGGANNTCSVGYTGPLCVQCDYASNFVSDSKGNCGKCDYGAGSYMIGLVSLLGGILYQAFLVWSSFRIRRSQYFQESTLLKGPTELSEKPRAAEFMVIFTTFNQFFAIFSSFGWSAVLGVLTVAQTVANPSKQFFQSIRCILYSRVATPLNELQFEVLLYVFSPIMKLLVVFVVELTRMVVIKGGRESKVNMAVRLGTIAIVLTLLEQPNIIGALTNYLSCSRLDPNVETEFIKQPNSVQCFTPEYNHFRNIAVIPALLFWGFAVPVTIFLMLYIYRKSLATSSNLCIVFGNLCRGYAPKVYYWGVLIIFFKMLIFTLDSVLNVPEIKKCWIFLLLVQIYHLLLTRIPPYKRRVLFDAEVYCTHAYRITLMANVFKFYLDDDRINTACDILALLSAIFVSSYLLFHVCRIHLNTAKEKANALKEKMQDRKILKKTLDGLIEYHIERGETKFDNKVRRRRNAIQIKRSPPSHRNQEEMKVEQPEAIIFTQRGTMTNEGIEIPKRIHLEIDNPSRGESSSQKELNDRSATPNSEYLLKGENPARLTDFTVPDYDFRTMTGDDEENELKKKTPYHTRPTNAKYRTACDGSP